MFPILNSIHTLRVDYLLTLVQSTSLKHNVYIQKYGSVRSNSSDERRYPFQSPGGRKAQD